MIANTDTLLCPEHSDTAPLTVGGGAFVSCSVYGCLWGLETCGHQVHVDEYGETTYCCKGSSHQGPHVDPKGRATSGVIEYEVTFEPRTCSKCTATDNLKRRLIRDELICDACDVRLGALMLQMMSRDTAPIGGCRYCGRELNRAKNSTICGKCARNIRVNKAGT